jgi:PEP-CTERM motif
MKTPFSKCFPLFARLKSGTHVACPGKCRRLALLVIPPLMAGMLCVTSPAMAEDYRFLVSEGGIAAAGTLQVSNTGPFGASTVTGINGNFTDSNNNFSGAITGLNFAPAPVTDLSDTYFSAPAFTTASFSYDNLFWSGGNSPAVCVDAPIFFGGDFDIYGLSFNVAGGYTVDLWSNGPDLGGYQLNDSLNGAPFVTPNMDGLAYGVDFAASPTPEPSSLLLLGSGMTGLFTLMRRKRTA